MCRIAGIIDYKKSSNLDDFRKALSSSLDFLFNGGPDDVGTFIDEDKHILLGNRRLSIIDLSSSGHQPMSNIDESIWITYNGEIYNFKEIRADLIQRGYKFRSNTDTEVIINSYIEWGTDSFDKFEGMFAFCLYDKLNNYVFLVRDYAGIKPLYYSISDKGLFFASEVKAIKILNNSINENEDWRSFFALFGSIPEPYTTLKDVYEIPKGSFLKLNLKSGHYTIEQFSKIKFKNDFVEIEEARKEIRELFLKAVESHLISDAPIGVFLSGGIDSSLITLVAARFKETNLKTLSVVFEEAEYSEEKYQKIIANKIRSDHRSYLIREKDFLNELDNIFEAMDQPTIDGINTYFISKFAKEAGLKVVLSGIGSDEIFGGYPSFYRINEIWFLKNRKFKNVFNIFENFKNKKIKKFSYFSIPNMISFYLFFRGIFSINDTARILGISKKKILDNLENVYIKDDANLSKGNFVSYMETNFYMQNQLLKDTDFMSMKNSVEIRVPFLDKKLMNFVFSLDDKIKFKRSIPKFLLTTSFKNFIPDEIVFRKKQGFTFPFELWIRNNIDLFSQFLDNKNDPLIEGIISDFKDKKIHWSKFWNLVILSKYKI